MEKKVTLCLAVDVVVVNKFDLNADTKIVDISEIPEDWMGLDIGPKTIENIKNSLKDAKTILWNGPMGFFFFF